jgi:N-acetylglucosamine kinase-like BadF-type ATPase
LRTFLKYPESTPLRHVCEVPEYFNDEDRTNLIRFLYETTLKNKKIKKAKEE